MIKNKEQKNACDFCGDAPFNHAFLYFSTTFSALLEIPMLVLERHTPNFFKKFSNWFLDLIFKIMAFLKLIRFSDDLEKVISLRSRVVWEEANRRGLKVTQAIVFGKPTEHFQVKIGGKDFHYESLPLPSSYSEAELQPWDNKFFLKRKFSQENLPVPSFLRLARWHKTSSVDIFKKLSAPIIVKPAIGSRGRHTTTNIHTLEDLTQAMSVGFMVSPTLVIEEHLHGYVCRATFVDGELVGFYRGEAPYIIGDGVHSIEALIQDKNKNRPETVSEIKISREVNEYLKRSGFNLYDILKEGEKLFLTHRTGRYFGGRTKEMLSLLHPSFIPILTKAAKVTGLPVLGFDCIIPDPEKSAADQRWGIIECNTLPFIDLHYFSFEGKREKNIAGLVWDLFEKNLI